MSWADCMRLKRRADRVRMVGWVNFGITVLVAAVETSEGWVVLAVSGAWVAVVLALTHGMAWLIDRHADSIVRR